MTAINMDPMDPSKSESVVDLTPLSDESVYFLHGIIEQLVERGIGLWMVLLLVFSFPFSRPLSGFALSAWAIYSAFLLIWWVSPVVAIRKHTVGRVPPNEHQRIYDKVCGIGSTLRAFSLVFVTTAIFGGLVFLFG